MLKSSLLTMIIIPIFEEIFWSDHNCQQYVGQHEQSFGKHCSPYDCQLDLCKGYKIVPFFKTNISINSKFRYGLRVEI